MRKAAQEIGKNIYIGAVMSESARKAGGHLPLQIGTQGYSQVQELLLIFISFIIIIHLIKQMQTLILYWQRQKQ
jgi:hypothetical protein